MKSEKKRSKNKNSTIRNKIKKCRETFVKNKIRYWTKDVTNKIQKLESNKGKKSDNQLILDLKKQKKEQIEQLKKQYMLYNCNWNCKNTILEPGLPNKIPKSMENELNDKELIKMYNDQRKSIFQKKTNVLIDHFYENTPRNTKKQLLKEGAISHCIPTYSVP
jgi:hypothetical protein